MEEYGYIDTFYDKIKDLFPESYIQSYENNFLKSEINDYGSLLLTNKFTPLVFSQAFSITMVKNTKQLVKEIIEKIYDYAMIDILIGKMSEKHRLIEDIIFLILATNIKNKKVMQVWFALWRIIVKTHTIAIDNTGSLHYSVPASYFPIIFEKSRARKNEILKTTIKNITESIEEEKKEKPENNSVNASKTVSKNILSKISSTLFFIDFQYKFEHLLIALQLINNPNLSNGELALITGKHRNTIRTLKDELIDNRLLRVAYRYSYRALNLQTTVIILNKSKNNEKNDYFNEIIQLNDNNPWLFRGYKTEKANFLFYLHPNDLETNKTVDKYKSFLEGEYGVDVDKMTSNNKITFRSYNFTSYDPLYGTWSEKEAELERYYQEKSIAEFTRDKPFHKFFLKHENTIHWVKPPTFKIKELHFEIINHYARHKVSKDLTVRFMRKKLEKGQSKFLEAKDEILREKIVIPYADLFARSFKNSLLTIKEIKKGDGVIETPSELLKQPISWSSIYKKNNRRYLLSMTPVMSKSVIREKEMSKYDFYSFYLPKETLSSNWNLPTEKWDSLGSKWISLESDFFKV